MSLPWSSATGGAGHLRVRQAEAPRPVADLAVRRAVALVVRAVLRGAELEVLLDLVALEGAGQAGRVRGGALEQAGQLGRVDREQLEDRLGDLRRPGSGWPRSRGARRSRCRARPWRSEKKTPSCSSLSMTVLRGGGDVAQHAEQVGRGEVVGVGDVGELDQVLPQRRQVRRRSRRGRCRARPSSRRAARRGRRARWPGRSGWRSGRPAAPTRSSGNRSARIRLQLDVGLDPVGRDHVAVASAGSTTGRRGGRTR